MPKIDKNNTFARFVAYLNTKVGELVSVGELEQALDVQFMKIRNTYVLRSKTIGFLDIVDKGVYKGASTARFRVAKAYPDGYNTSDLLADLRIHQGLLP